jgi:hypothetical protein
MFSIYLILPAALGPGVYSASNIKIIFLGSRARPVLGPAVYSASNRNEYQKQKNNISGEQSAADV